MRMQVILDSPFARSGSAPIGGGKKGEFRDWNILNSKLSLYESVNIYSKRLASVNLLLQIILCSYWGSLYSRYNLHRAEP